MSSTSHPTPHSKTKYEWVSDMFQFSTPKVLKNRKKKGSAPSIFNTDMNSTNTISIQSSKTSTHSSTTIQTISKPTDFEHGIHIEYNDQSGRFMGVPDVWKQTIPYDDLLNTQYIDPLLVPSTPQINFEPSDSCPAISSPYNLKHNMNVHVDEYGNTTAVGIPPEWIPIFAQSGLSLEDVRSQPELFEKIFNQKTGSVNIKNFGNLISSSKFASLFSKRLTATGGLPPQKNSSLRISITSNPLLEKDSPTSNISHLSAPETPESRDHDPMSPTLPDIEPMEPILLDDAIKVTLDEFNLVGYVNLTVDPTSRFLDMNLIAEGESGDVYTAQDRQVNNSVIAVKVIPYTEMAKLSSLKNELEAMRSCNHPNLVSLLGCYSTCESLWMTMECMDLGSLCDIVSSYPTIKMTESQIARFSYDILCGLAFLEGCHRIHRDLNSDNILLNSRGHIKIADFNRCVIATPPEVRRTSCVISTHWMAPEVAKMQHYDWRADVWSFGMLLMEMAEGTSPFSDYPAVQFVSVISNARQPRLKQPSLWSDKFINFFSQTVEPESDRRTFASSLLDHSFLNVKCTSTEVVALYDQCRAVFAE